MSGIAADPGSNLFSQTALNALFQAIGGTQDQDTINTGTNTGSTSKNTSTTANTTGTNNSSTTGTRTGTNNSTTTNTADIANLMKVFEQQQAGITPEALAAIFAEGAKKTPGLIAATANAVGARSGNNTPLATALTKLSGDLTNQAALMSLDQRNRSAETAAKIAELTRSSTTTGNSNESSTQATAGTNTSTTTQAATETGTTSGTNTSNTNQQTDSQPNYGNLTKILGLLLGGQVLNQGLEGFGGLGGAINSGTNALGNLLQGLISPGQPGFVGPMPQDPFGGIPEVQMPSLQNAIGGQPGFAGTTITPGAQSGLAALLTGGINAGAAGQPGLEQLFKELGLSATSSEADFWSAIGIDPNSLSSGDVEGATDLSDFSWWTDEGWDNVGDFGLPED